MSLTQKRKKNLLKKTHSSLDIKKMRSSTIIFHFKFDFR